MEKHEVNWRYQSLHARDASGIDWVLCQQLERDICLLYHQLSEYSSIMPDLYYGTIYRLPYWDFLDVQGISEHDRVFIRDGCLVMILAMCCEQIDGVGSYIDSFLAQCVRAVDRVESADHQTDELLRTVKLALSLVSESKAETEELRELSSWVHKTYVRGYFIKKADAFATSPYFKDED